MTKALAILGTVLIMGLGILGPVLGGDTHTALGYYATAAGCTVAASGFGLFFAVLTDE